MGQPVKKKKQFVPIKEKNISVVAIKKKSKSARVRYFFVHSKRIVRDKKPILSALTLSKIYGVGVFRLRNFCRFAGFSSFAKVFSLCPYHIQRLNYVMRGLGSKGNDLRQQIAYWRYHEKLKTFKGLRYIAGLPVRGQRTRSNAKSVRRWVHAIRSVPFRQS